MAIDSSYDDIHASSFPTATTSSECSILVTRFCYFEMLSSSLKSGWKVCFHEGRSNHCDDCKKDYWNKEHLREYIRTVHKGRFAHCDV